MAEIYAAEKGPDIPIVELARRVKKTRAVVYKHLRDFEALGLIDKDYRVTEEGRLTLCSLTWMGNRCMRKCRGS